MLMSTQKIIGGTLHAFIAEGATNVWSEVMQGLQSEYNHHVGVLALHNSILRDGIDQQSINDKNFNQFTEAGVFTEALDRRDEGKDSLPPYSEADVERLVTFMLRSQVIATLEERPMGTLDILDVRDLPPVVMNLFRSGDHKSDKLIKEITNHLKSNTVAMLTVDADASKESYVRRGIPPGSITVIHNGIDIDKFKPSKPERIRIRKELSIPDDAPVVLLVGRDNPEKDIALFIESARVFLEQSPNSHAIMLGPGLSSDNPNIISLLGDDLVDVNGMGSRLHTVGLRSDIPAFYAAADVLALTSITESRPLCISEAQASGLGVAVTTLAGDSASMVGSHGFISGRNSDEIASLWEEAYAKRFELGFPLEQREILGKKKMIDAYNQTLLEVTA